ncbi:hypothetical protein WDZ17_15535 [Pseudokineococcus basanitobsidens]|uniref:Uncharacterized protein n=1 Tax=Pseudokineococcus basanitobsidens TaxID=1926649 RepID=A0ABU8RP08_9ACTN
MGAFAVWVTVDAVRTAAGPAGDWWDRVVVAVLGVFYFFGLAVAVGALADWRRRRASA